MSLQPRRNHLTRLYALYDYYRMFCVLYVHAARRGEWCRIRDDIIHIIGQGDALRNLRDGGDGVFGDGGS